MIMVAVSPELVGYIGGVIGSVSLIPQVVHTCRTNSAKDLSYSWQIIHLTGLSVDVIYMALLGATAGWVTLLVEIGFVLLLLVMKVRLEWNSVSSCVSYQRAASMSKEDGDDEDEETMDCSSSSSSSSNSLDELYDLEQPAVRQLDRSSSPPVPNRISSPPPLSSTGTATTDDDPLRFHVDIDISNATGTANLSLEFGYQLLSELHCLAQRHNVTLGNPRVEIWDTDCDVVGDNEKDVNGSVPCWNGFFAVQAWMDTNCSSVSIHGCIHDQTITVDYWCRPRRHCPSGTTVRLAKQPLSPRPNHHGILLHALVDVIRSHHPDSRVRGETSIPPLESSEKHHSNAVITL